MKTNGFRRFNEPSYTELERIPFQSRGSVFMKFLTRENVGDENDIFCSKVFFSKPYVQRNIVFGHAF